MKADMKVRSISIAMVLLAGAVVLGGTTRQATAQNGATTLQALDNGNQGGSAQSDKPEIKADDKEHKDDKGDKGGSGFGNQQMLLLLMVGAFVLFYIWMGSSRRKQEKKRRAMLANIKKGDKVTSIGGIIGTVVETREDEVIMKIDDNSRIHLARWALRGVGEEGKAEQQGQAQAKKEDDKK